MFVKWGRGGLLWIHFFLQESGKLAWASLFLFLTSISACKRSYTVFCKNTLNFREPPIFLTSGCYFSHFPPLSPFEDRFKLQAFFSNSQIYFNVNISWDRQKYWTKSSLCLGILINGILIKKKVYFVLILLIFIPLRCLHFINLLEIKYILKLKQ